MKNWSIKEIENLIEDVADFPKPGVLFKDITPILENNQAFVSLARHFAESLPAETTHLVAIESRGFILGAAVAQHRPIGVVLARKPGKLPRKTVSHTYDLEYGTDTLQIHEHALDENSKVIIIDDVLATGGTAHATETLVTKCGAQVLGHRFLMEIKFLEGGKKLSTPYQAFIHY
ncbi:MAG: adenine phosphoribosyltransferase [Bdellovibrionaceae bacterium]|nr:adenine phosphoribosyltransferase [Bdellovibrionales bacterium]MCB9083556.1 adenine phosphoribosyltransferase [Pseudobdellovibrionaceae bacterium]